MSSNFEGFGLTALEGMAAEKPVIASNVPGLSEVVEAVSYTHLDVYKRQVIALEIVSGKPRKKNA